MRGGRRAGSGRKPGWNASAVCVCGRDKSRYALTCTGCRVPGVRMEQAKRAARPINRRRMCPMCGRRKMAAAARCRACDRSIYLARSASRKLCACGRRCDRESRGCVACMRAAEAARRADRVAQAIAAAVQRECDREVRRRSAAAKPAPALVAHVCPNCGASFTGFARRVFCGDVCGRALHRMIGRGRYPAVGRVASVAERNRIAALVAVVRAGQRRLQDLGAEAG